MLDIDPDLEGTARFARGATVDRYIILDPLGKGGMGLVLRAYDKMLQREVALKIVRPTRSSPTAHRRLVREAQAMARLNHPNVVAVYDVKVLDEDVMLAMELITGQTLHRWLQGTRRADLGWQAVLEVLIQAGRGLAAAHRAGVVHRDFKPANVLVGDDGQVKVTDFGLARTSSGPLGAEALSGESRLSKPASRDGREPPSITRNGAVMGTAGYVAPEQHASAPPQPQTDQYAFCVTAWRALTGEKPFEGRGSFLLERQRRGPPPWPRDVRAPPKIAAVLQQGLSPDPDDRWPSMEHLLDELEWAAPPGKRRLWAFATGTMTSLALVGTWLLSPPNQETCTRATRPLAKVWNPERRAAIAQRFARLEVPYAASTGTRAVERLEQYTKTWEDRYHEACLATHVDRSQSDVELDQVMTCLRRRRSELDAAVALFEGANAEIAQRAFEVLASLEPVETCVPTPEASEGAAYPTSVQAEAVRDELGHVRALASAGQYATALARLAPLFERERQLDEPVLRAELELQEGSLLAKSGRYARAEESSKRAHALALRLGRDRLAARAAIDLTHTVGLLQARFRDGRSWGEMALAFARRLDDPMLEAKALSAVGNLVYAEGRFSEAAAHHRRVLEIRSRRADDHPELVATLNNLGAISVELGELDEAIEYYDRALSVAHRLLPADHPQLASLLSNVAIADLERGDTERALDHHARALEIRREALGPNHPFVAASLQNLGAVHHSLDRLDEAERYYRQALDVQEIVLGADHPDTATVVHNLGLIALQRGQLAAALTHFERAIARLEASIGSDHPQVAFKRIDLATALLRDGRARRALDQAQLARDALADVLDDTHPHRMRARLELGLASLELGELERAVDLLESVLSGGQRTIEHPLHRARAQFGLARALARLGRQSTRSRRLANDASATLRDQGVDARYADLRSEIDRWLAVGRDGA